MAIFKMMVGFMVWLMFGESTQENAERAKQTFYR